MGYPRCPRCSGKTLTKDGLGVCCIACGWEEEARAAAWPDQLMACVLGRIAEGSELHLVVHPSLPAWQDQARYEGSSTPWIRRLA